MQQNLSISEKDLQDLYDYVAGKADKPLFLDRFTADLNGRLKEMLLVVTQLQLSRVPKLLEYYDSIQEKLVNSENINNMKLEESTKIMLNISKDFQSIIDTSIKTLQTINNYDSLNNSYRDLLNRMLLLSDEKINSIKDKLDIK